MISRTTSPTAAEAHDHERVAPLVLPRPRALLTGAALVVLLAFAIPYFNLTLTKFDWGFRPLGTGPIFFLLLLVWPINSLLRRFRPGLAFTGGELLLMYAMMALTAALAGEGLSVYVLVNSVFPQYFATPENRWGELFIPHVPTWMQVTHPDAVRWFFEGAPAGAALPWGVWVAPIVGWSLFAFAMYLGFFCLSCLLRKDWIEGQRLAFPFAAVPVEFVGGAAATAGRPLLRNPLLWIGLALPVAQSLLQMAHTLWPAVPYTPFYWQIGRAFGETGPLSSLQRTFAYLGFETIGILALLPAEVSLSLWVFYLVNRVEVFSFAALGYGQEGISARVFSPEAFITYQESGGALMLALLLLWASRKAILAAFGRLLGRPAASDPSSPLSPAAAALGLLASTAFLLFWAARGGMSLGTFVVMMALFYGYTLAACRLVAAAGIYVPSFSLGPRELMVGVTGTAAYSPRTLSLVTFFSFIFTQQYKVNFMHFAMNDLKVAHSARLRGRTVAVALLVAVVLMMAISPWTNLAATYGRGASLLDAWQFRDAGAGTFAQLASDLHSPQSSDPYLLPGLACGAGVMLLLNWLHTSFLWWGLSPVGFVMAGTFAMNARIWTNALVAWLLVVLLRRFGGLRLYAKMRPAFLGMVLGHFAIMGLRSIIDPMLGLTMQLSPWS